ncbi:MAG: hydroxyisourate hydrolase [Terracidiphilus sp.]|jgi:5-hydroxyisourate hydrolase
MSAISTHVLDVVLGKPAAGIPVHLQILEGDEWIEFSTVSSPAYRARDVSGSWATVFTSITDADGRCRDLAKNAVRGCYRLTFKTGAYLAQAGRSTIYPEISITFNCEGEEHYHLPLLLSDNSYTTYRGS